MHKKINEKVIGGIIFIAYALFFIIPSFGYKIGMVVNNNWQPGAGFFPLLTGGLVLIAGVILIFEGLFKKEKTAEEAQETVAEEVLGELSEEISEELSEEIVAEQPIDPAQRKSNSILLLCTVLTVFLMLVLWSLVGFYPAIILMCLALNFFYKDKPLTSILLTAVLVGFVFLGFTTGLNITFRI